MKDIKWHKETPKIYKDDFESGMKFGHKETIDEVLKLIDNLINEGSHHGFEFHACSPIIVLRKEVEKLKE